MEGPLSIVAKIRAALKMLKLVLLPWMCFLLVRAGDSDRANAMGGGGPLGKGLGVPDRPGGVKKAGKTIRKTVAKY